MMANYYAKCQICGFYILWNIGMFESVIFGVYCGVLVS